MQPPSNPPSPPLNHPITTTQRIILLIDLHPILTTPPNPTYISTVTAAASRLLRFPQLSSTLFSYTFFSSSSISPQQSAALFPITPISFNFPFQTLDSLSKSINSIQIIDVDLNSLDSSLSCVGNSLVQLIQDCVWETEEDVDLFGKDGLIGFESCRNLVILFSPVVGYADCFNCGDVFGSVKEMFLSKGIHLCWVDVVENGEELKSDCGLKDGITKLGWRFCTSDLIILGSALVPLGLIYPKIGVPFDMVGLDGLERRKCFGALSLEILDVNSKPLECKCCDLEFVSLPNGLETGDVVSKCGQDTFLGCFGNQNVKLHVTEVYGYDVCVNSGGVSETVLVCERIQGSGKDTRKSSGDFFADRVLEMLHKEMGGANNKSQSPIWQIFLSFLYMKGYCALVSISSSDGSTLMGSLKPFTSHWAVLSVFYDDCIPAKAKIESQLSRLDIQPHCADDTNNSNGCHGSQTETSTSGNCAPNRDGKKKKSRRQSYHEMSWPSFCKAAFEGFDFDLFEVYSSRQMEKSKKLKFLKCWIKQILKVGPYQLTTLQESKPLEVLPKCNGLLSLEPSHEQLSTMPFSNAETLESFFNIVHKTIQHSLESGMDLQNLAERVVKSSFQWLNQKCETENNSEGQQSKRDTSGPYSRAVELIKYLLKKPKEMKKIHQDDASSDNIVREYEMQIFLRMEVLLSDLSAMIDESRKRKLVKQICSMLELMQYLVAGGLHGHSSLYDYVEQIIKARYSNKLQDVVEKIYSELEMDLLVFGGEDETPNLLFNSEDSNHSWRDSKHERSKIAEANYNNNRSLSTEGDSSQPPISADESPDKHARILSEAKERRERNRRYVSFTSQAPDLRRVWAPKQAKPTKDKYSLPKRSRKKDRRGSRYSVVSETPMTGNKRTRSRENKKGDEEWHDSGMSSYSVSKALFQDM